MVSPSIWKKSLTLKLHKTGAPRKKYDCVRSISLFNLLKKEQKHMSKRSRSKREIQQGKDAVQPNNERYNNVTTMAEAEKPNRNTGRDCDE